MKTRQQAADEWVEKYAFRVPYNGTNDFYDKEAIKHGTAGFLAGCEFEAQNHRDFYLLVREYFYGSDKRKSEEAYGKISQHIKTFTSRELESLPFKD